MSSDLAHGPRKACIWRAGESSVDDADDYGSADTEQDDWEGGDDHYGAMQTMTGRPRGAPGPTRLGRTPGQQVSSQHLYHAWTLLSAAQLMPDGALQHRCSSLLMGCQSSGHLTRPLDTAASWI